MVDEGITFADLKGTLQLFIERMFGPEAKVRFRLSYFPFRNLVQKWTSLHNLWGIRLPRGKDTGWLEILGCGMVDPRVLRGVNYDPDVGEWFRVRHGSGAYRDAPLRHQRHSPAL